MADLKLMTEKVRWELTHRPELRDDDFKLICAIYTDFYGIMPYTSFTDVMSHHADYKLPSFESIRRTRQKLQEAYPKLYGSSETIKAIREKEQMEFYAWAKKGEQMCLGMK